MRYFASTMKTDGGPLNIAISRKTDKQQTMSLDISRQLQALFHNPRRQAEKTMTSFALRLNENQLSLVWKNNFEWNNEHEKCLVKRQFRKQRTSVSSRLTNGASLKIAIREWQKPWRQSSRTKHHGVHCTKLKLTTKSKHVDFKRTPGSVWSPELISAPPWDSVISEAMRSGLELLPLNSLNCKQAKNYVYSKKRFARETYFFKEVC